MSWEGNRPDPGPGGVCAVRSSLSAREDSLLILLAGVIVFTVAPMREFISLDTRFAFFAKEMLRNGPTFFPTTYQTPYPDYPAASTFLIYLVSLPFGRVTPFTAILPTAVVSALVLLVIYRIGALRSRRSGLTAVLFALLTAEFFSTSRRIALDQYTSLATAFSFYLVFSSDRLGRHRRLWLLPLAWAWGLIFRGPIGLLLPAAVTCVYYLWNGRFRQTLLMGTLAGAMFVLGLGGLLLAARAQGGTPFMRQVLASELVSRLGGRGPGFAYYWYESLVCYAVAYPLAILVVVSRFKSIVNRRTEEDRLLGVLFLWVFVILLLMSVPVAKKIRYVVPIVPACSLMAASIMADVPLHGLLLRTKQVFLGVCAWLPRVCVVVVAGLSLFACLKQPEWRTFTLGTLGLLIAPLIVARKLDRGWRSVPHRDVGLLAVGTVTFIIVHIGVAGPVMCSLERTVPFVRQVETLLAETPGRVTFFQVGPDAEDVKFMANSSRPLEARFAGSLEALSDTPDARYIVAKEVVFHSLPIAEDRPMCLVARGRIGHKDFVVFTWDNK